MSSLSDYNDHARSVRMYSSSQVSFPMSVTSDARERSVSPVMYTPTQQLEYPSFDNFQFHDGDMNDSSFLYRDSVSMPPRSVAGSVATDHSTSMFSTAEDIPFGPEERPPRSMAGQISVSTTGPMSFQAEEAMDTASLWRPTTLESQTSSPVLFTASWALNQQMAATTNPNTYSPSIPSTVGLSPRFEPAELPETMISFAAMPERQVRKPVGPRLSKVASDISNRGRSSNSDESFKLAARPSVEVDNSARDHPLYQNAKPDENGLYHCPFEGKSCCQHKADKLKCNYEYETLITLCST